MKYFWWTKGDVDFAIAPVLHHTIDGNQFQSEHQAGAAIVSKLLDQGYIEISQRTAFVLGLPA